MQKLRIRNFGPITDGYSEGFFDINKCSVIIGEQGSGKSTIAKVYSIFSWLEKDFLRDDGNVQNFGSAEFKNICGNQNLADYFSDETELEYIGCKYSFSFIRDCFKSKKRNDVSYNKPKIMYIPSERNLLTVLKTADKIQKLPPMLRLLQREYNNALTSSKGKILDLPVKDFKLRYNQQSQAASVLYKNKELEIQNASSGLQSLVPISIVVNYLFSDVEKPLLDFVKDFSNYDIEKIHEKIDSFWKDSIICGHLKNIFEQNYLNGNIQSVSENDRSMIEQVLKDYVNSCLFTIIEEPEQNLFPVSQVCVLEELIQINNARPENRLFITTHSPYILSALNNYIYAEEVYSKRHKAIDDVKKELFLNIKDVSAYKLENGHIIDIKNTEYNLIDTTQIDDCSSIINSVYDRLVALDE